ncbi:hypothetical protein H920_13166 [Fukomys damarensis]|uniref:Uncharacterized protein n=1 Tax=Fukomys damarensis TaxID=885580 RepID=A0A091D568_FUKDA|nr:hypothetical protein H920_13166 [Fukomys damarensis]
MGLEVDPPFSTSRASEIAQQEEGGSCLTYTVSKINYLKKKEEEKEKEKEGMKKKEEKRKKEEKEKEREEGQKEKEKKEKEVAEFDQSKV